MVFLFENLDVYKESIMFSNYIYKVTSDFPKHEIFGIISQLRRASVSISANIAEGSARYHKENFRQFLRISRGSLYEIVPLTRIALEQKYIDDESFEKIYIWCNRLAMMINGLIRSMDKK